MAAEEGSTTGTRQFDNKVKRAIPSVVHMIAGAEDAQQSEEAYNAGKFEVCRASSVVIIRAWRFCFIRLASTYLIQCACVPGICSHLPINFALLLLSISWCLFVLSLLYLDRSKSFTISRALVKRKSASKSYWQGWRGLYFRALTGLVPKSALVR
jgi:hypothetical protein